MIKSKSLFLATTAIFAVVGPSMAFAQTVANDKLDTVIVTARKRSEDILKIPVAVTAFTGAELVNRDIKTLFDLANFTPGLTNDVASAGGARVDRSTQLFIIRGMNPSTSLSPTTSVFLNGVPLGASDFLQNLDDVDHVEVLKGPQSAYFGRETFAGAINAVAKSAGNTFTYNLSAEVATRNTENFSGSVTVPLIDDKLSVRVGGFYDNHDGSYKNAANPSQTLGDQTTKSAHIQVTAHPIENLTIKAFAIGFEDDDGPEATGLLLASGPAAFNQSNCTVNGARFFCGTLPGLISSVTPAEVDKVTAGQAAFFNNPGGIIKESDIIKHFGLKRIAYHGDVNVDYYIPSLGLTATYLGGFSRDNYSSVSDLANEDNSATGQYPGYAGFPFLVETQNHDYSHEFRLASDPSKPLRGLVGASYLDVFHDAVNYSLGGTPGPAPVGAPTVSQTSGVFFSLAYDFNSKLTLTAEGRYQSDKEKAFTTTRAIAAQGKSTDFLPRVSLQYKFTPDMMAYATYSKGVNPGIFNTQYNTLPATTQAALNASGSAGGLAVKPEQLTNYEVGFKGSFFNGRATLAADVYYDKWDHQINTNVHLFAATDPANPYNVVGGPQYNPTLNSTFIYSFQDNSARSTAKGVEAEANIIPIEHLTLNLSGAYNETKYDAYACTSCSPYSGAYPGFNAAGKYLANAPRFSANVGAEYRRSANFLNAHDWFIRGDYIYHDGLYIQASNTAKTGDANIVNLRAGVDWKGVTFEAFVNNLFNDKAYTTGFQNYNFAGFFSPAVMVGLPQLITGGVRLRYKY